MYALIPHLISMHYQAGRSCGELEVVSLFVDISGFTALTETLMQHQKDGAELLTAALNGIFQPLVDTVYAHGGFISTFAGDAFTALFPLAANPTEAALHAAATAFFMQQFITHQGIVQTKYGDFTLGVKVGLSVGVAAWGILGGSHEQQSLQTYFFRGPAIDGCAQAEHQAGRGEIIAEARLYTLLAEYVAARPLGDYVQLTGLHRVPPPDKPLPAPLSVAALRPFVLDAVLDLATSGALAEFRQIAIVFISFTESADSQHLNRFATTVLELAGIYDGYFNKLDFGDKGGVILLLFGAPLSHENDMERAADFLLSLADQTTSLDWRAGLTSGTVYAGFLGGSERSEYTAIGDVVNLAARLMMAADWGEIWISPLVAHQLARRGYQMERRGSFTFKGKRAPVAVSRLLHKQAGAAPGAGERHYGVPLIGRETELAQLLNRIEPAVCVPGQQQPASAQAPFAGLIQIYGEAGMGKSRLVYALRERLQQCWHLRWLICPADAILQQSLNPFKHMLSDYFVQIPDHPFEENRARFDYLLDDLIAATALRSNILTRELERTRSFLAALVNLRWDGSLYERLEPRLRFENTLLALQTLLQAESLHQPLVVEIEDLHWLDADSRELLTMLTRNLQGYAVALLCTSRYRDDGSLVPLAVDERAPQHVLELTSLAGPDVKAFAARVLDGSVTDTLVQFLLEKTGGNPFFLEQMVLDLHERGAIAPLDADRPQATDELRGDGRCWSLVADWQLVDVPTSINAVLIARLDRLSVQVRQVVQTAAVLGREFSVLVLSQMLRNDDRLLLKVKTADKEGIWALVSEMRYLFRHALLRDAAYSMQLRSRLRELHALAGGAMEQLYAADLPPHYADLAYHYGQAEDLARERLYAGLAGEWSAAHYANTEAIASLTRALELTSDADRDRRYELLLVREQVYDRQGARAAQLHDLRALAELATLLDKPTYQAEVALRQANYSNVTGDFPTAIAAAQRAIALTRGRAEVHLTATGYLRWGFGLWSQGYYQEAQQQLQQSLHLAQSAALPAIEAESLYQLGKVAYLQGDYISAQWAGEQALTLYRTREDRQGEAQALNHLANIEGDQGNYSAATMYYEQALAIHRAMGDRYGEGVVLSNLGYHYLNQGDFASSTAYYERALAICRVIGDQQGVAIALINLGGIYNDQGDYASAAHHFEQALPICRAIGDQDSLAFVLDGLGVLCQYQGDYSGALTYYEQALTISEAIGDQQGVGRILALLGLIAHNLGDHAAARESLQKALQIEQDSGKLYESGSALTYMGHALAGLGQFAEAMEMYEQALETLREAGRMNQAMEVLAGMARVYLAQGNLPRSNDLVGQIVQHLQDEPLLAGADEPFRVYLTCYQVLRIGQSTRATEVLQAACRLLHERAALIKDERLQRSFLARVPAHRDLLLSCADLMERQSRAADRGETNLPQLSDTAGG